MSRRYYFAPATGSVHAAEHVEGAHDAAIGSTFVPCVVIDPEDSGQVNRLVGLLAERGWIATQSHGLRDALRELAKPPKPAEPTGLGAVVEDANGSQYVRLATKDDAPWHLQPEGPIGFNAHPYHEIDAVRVLSEGVTQP